MVPMDLHVHAYRHVHVHACMHAYTHTVYMNAYRILHVCIYTGYMHECIIYVMTENLEVKGCGDGLILITEAEVEPYTLTYAYYPSWGAIVSCHFLTVMLLCFVALFGAEVCKTR